MNTFLKAGLLCLSLWLPGLQAADSGWLKAPNNPHSQVRLRSLDQPDQPVQMLLDIKLAPGWKTYWRAPGEGGVAPAITWASPMRNSVIDWPTPERFTVAGLATQGYHGEVSLPLTLTPDDEGPLRGTLTLPICSNVCVLTDFPFTLARQTSPGTDFTFDYRKTSGKVPVENALMAQADAFWQSGELVIDASRPQGWHQPDAYFDLPDDAFAGQPVFTVEGSRLQVRVPVTSGWGEEAKSLAGQHVSVILTDGDIAQQNRLVVQPGSTLPGQTALSGWYIFVLALAGGFILNLMPCVLPVLGYKLGTLIQADRRDQHAIRSAFLASSAGIILAFALLALLMTVLRLSGQALGWGIQFQNPWFIGVLVVATLLFSASLFDLCHFRLPGNLATRMATHRTRGIGSHVVQGMFATLLATPCSAPFLGSAVAWALAASLPGLWGVFIALGLGMSLPWLLVALVPKLALLLPKPGRWMLRLRALLGLMMLASSYWLLSLLAGFIGTRTTWVVGLMMAAALVIALGRHYGWRFIAKTVSAGVLLATVVGVTLAGTSRWWGSSVNDNIVWQPLSEQAVEQALAARKRVFVDITANWCVTCKANKFNVLMQPEVQKALSASDVVALRGDWSQPDALISAYLQRQGQVAVPFNQIFGPGLTQGKVLPSLLDSQTLLNTLKQAAGDQP